MKIECLQSELADALGVVGRAVTTRSSLPVLENVLFAVEEESGRLKLSATDLELAITDYVGCKVHDDGSVMSAITVPRKTINDFVRALPEEPVSLSFEELGMSLRVKSGRFSANIKGITAEEFPLLPEINEEAQLEIETEQLLTLVNRVAFSAASEDSRPTLTGVLISVNGDEIVMAATDGFRLSEARARLSTYPDVAAFTRIVPSRALEEVARIAKDVDIVRIFLPVDPDTRIYFRAEDVTIFSQVIDGNFPDYQAVIPKGSNAQATVEVGRFAGAVKLANVFAREAANTIKLALQPSENGDGADEGTIAIAGESSETGDQHSSMPAHIEGEAMDITVNALYMKEALDAVGTPQATLYFRSNVEPLVMRPHGDEADDFFHLVMPMQFGR